MAFITAQNCKFKFMLIKTLKFIKLQLIFCKEKKKSIKVEQNLTIYATYFVVQM